MRRILLLVALLASGATLLAAERATFIMTDGERVSGVLASRPFAAGNLTRGSFLVTVNDRDVQLPMNEVAAIDFAGGQPGARELDGLSRGGGHLLVMRDGRILEGRMLNLIRGDTVRWSYEPGDTEDIPIREVSRLYLNIDAARSAYGRTGARYGTPTYDRYGNPVYTDDRYGRPYSDRRSSAYGRLLSPPNGFVIAARTPWTDTSVTVQAGDMLSFGASGEIRWDATQTAPPDGNPGLRRDSYPVPALPVGALIGRVGREVFPIGSNTDLIRMPATGRLLLGVNDDRVNDNSGAFQVVVRQRDY